MRLGNLLGALLATATAVAERTNEAVDSASGVPGERFEARQTCSGPVQGNPTTWWRAAIDHDGKTPTASDTTFQYYRTAVQYGADNTGVNDSSEFFNFAINAWNRTGNTVTTMPAYIYIPPGTYRIKKSIQMSVSTYLVGDPLNPPTLLADPELGNKSVINGFDGYQGDGSSTKNFYMSVRNINIDTTEIDTNIPATAIDWSVSQACSLNNVHITMPSSSRHTGISMNNGGSGTIIADCSFRGGDVGIQLNNQQYNFKGLTFDGCGIGINITTVFVATFQDIVFANCKYGVNTGAYAGAISIVDSSVSSCAAGVNAYVSGGAPGSLTLDNFKTDTGTVAVRSGTGDTLLQGSVPVGQTWVLGNSNPQGYQGGKLYQIKRPTALVSNDQYFTISAPQYEKYDIGQIISLKNDSEYPVYGDNSHNDGPSINAILKKYANCKIIFVPQGIYVTNETIYVPPGTRLVGEVLSVFTGNGSTFRNSDDPTPIVKVGNPGEKGVAQISDILVEVSDVLEGAILMQVNMAGNSPGDVGVWNTVLRVGGSRESLVNTRCTSTDTSTCKAAFALLHVTNTASLYAENLWGWVADHSLEDGGAQNIAVGRGALIESTQPTWLVGTSFEHCTLYQYSLSKASNVYIGMQQTEAPYWQGNDQPDYAPTPWTPNTTYGDPTFSNCADQGQGDSGQCHRAWGLYASGSSNIVIHGSALWVFFNGMNDNKFKGAECSDYGSICELNMVYLSNANSTFMYSVSSKSTTNLVYDTTGGVNVAAQSNNTGGWGAVIAAYLKDSDIAENTVVAKESLGGTIPVPHIGLVLTLVVMLVAIPT